MVDKKYIRCVLTSGMGFCINYVISLVLTSYITEKLGIEAYGFVTLAKTLSNYASILTVCLNGYAARYIAIAYHERDMEKANAYCSSVLWANAALSACLLLVTGIVVIWLDSILQVPVHLLRDVAFLLMLDVLSFCVLSTGSVFSVFGHVADKLEHVHGAKLLSYAVEAVILLALFTLFDASITYVGIGLCLSSAVYAALNMMNTRRFLPQMRLHWFLCRFTAMKTLVVSGIWNSINSVGNLLQTGLDLMVCNAMLSSLAMGQLSIIKSTSAVFSTLFQMISNPFQPKMLQHYSQGNIQELLLLIQRSMKIAGFASVVLFTVLTVCGQQYFALLTPTQDIPLLYNLMLITMLGSLGEGISTPLFYVYTLTLKNRLPCMVTVASGFISVVCKYVLIRWFDMGVYAVAVTTMIWGWGTYFIFTPVYTAKCLKQRIRIFYPTILKIMGAGTISFAACFGLRHLSTGESWFSFLIHAALIVCVCLPLYTICVCDSVERKWLVGKLRHFMHVHITSML